MIIIAAIAILGLEKDLIKENELSITTLIPSITPSTINNFIGIKTKVEYFYSKEQLEVVREFSGEYSSLIAMEHPSKDLSIYLNSFIFKDDKEPSAYYIRLKDLSKKKVLNEKEDKQNARIKGCDFSYDEKRRVYIKVKESMLNEEIIISWPKQ